MILIKRGLGFVLYYLSYLFPRSSKKIVFGSNMGPFNDNPKYLYLFLLDQTIDFEIIWVTPFRSSIRKYRKRGVRMYYRWSFYGLWHSLTSKYYVVNSYVSDVNFYTSGRVHVINLWHGIGLKRIEFNIHEGPLAEKYQDSLKNRFLYPNIFRKPYKFLSTSRLMSEKTFCPAFRIKRCDCLELGYPRTDLFFKPLDKIKQYIDIEELSEDFLTLIESKFTYIYMPTWRDVGGDFIQIAGFDLLRLNDLMKSKNSIFIFKLHPNTNISPEKLNLFDNIFVVPNRVDIYPILPFTDVLITDYSSVFYDYLLLKEKGVLLFPFDYEDYMHNSRDFILDYYEFTQAKCVDTFECLLDTLNKDLYTNNIDLHLLTDQFWNGYNGSANSKILKYIKKDLINSKNIQ